MRKILIICTLILFGNIPIIDHAHAQCTTTVDANGTPGPVCSTQGGGVDGSGNLQPFFLPDTGSGFSTPRTQLIIPSSDSSVGLNPQTTGGCSPGFYLTTISTNSKNLKAAAAGTLCALQVLNTTATLVYLRLYDAAAAPTCSSATGVVAIFPVPANTAVGGFVVPLGSYGMAFVNGIGFCLTGGLPANDNSNAVVGVAVNYAFK